MRRVAVFARRPEVGRVKTRLSPALPAAQACALYRGMLADALAAAAASGAMDRRVYWAEDPADGAAPEPAPAGFREHVQRGADLGERLAHAFAEMLAAPADDAVILGADCPLLDGAVLQDAFEALEDADVVLGPARDGGYTLIGLSRPAPELFRGIDWSTPRVLEQTLAAADAAGLRAHPLSPLDDLDTPADVVGVVRARAGGAKGAGPHTLAALRGMGLLP